MPKHLVVIKFSKNLKEEVSKWKYSDVLKFLSDDKTDWATNLILYYIYQKDAFMLLNSKRAKWAINLKAVDMEYWRKFLADTNNFKKVNALGASK